MAHTTLVSTGRLADHLDGSWAIVDCRFDLQNAASGRTQYRDAHVPGAVYASLDDDLAGERTGRNGRHPIPPVDALAATLSRLGIDRHTQVVAYDQDTGLFASRLWWSLRYLGHDAVALLDGGFAKWMRERRPVRAGEESRARAEFRPDPDPAMRATVPEVEDLARTGAALLVDARGPERFEGQSEPIDKVPGNWPCSPLAVIASVSAAASPVMVAVEPVTAEV